MPINGGINRRGAACRSGMGRPAAASPKREVTVRNSEMGSVQPNACTQLTCSSIPQSAMQVFVVTALALLSHQGLGRHPGVSAADGGVGSSVAPFTGATVGHLLTSIRVVWPGRRPAFGSLCWRTVKRYDVLDDLDQPTRKAPGVLPGLACTPSRSPGSPA